MIFCKTLDVTEDISEITHIKNMHGVLVDIPHGFDHKHRSWEYGIGLKALRVAGATTVLDVGGGGSLFAPAAAWVGMLVTQVDPNTKKLPYTLAQEKKLDISLPYIPMNFMAYKDVTLYDAVTCFSVLEHIDNDVEFIKKLGSCVKPGGLLILTVDFHPSGQAMCPAHKRTYNKDSLKVLEKALTGFSIFGDGVDYKYTEPNVNGYTFASLIMRKKEDALPKYTPKRNTRSKTKK